MLSNGYKLTVGSPVPHGARYRSCSKHPALTKRAVDGASRCFQISVVGGKSQKVYDEMPTFQKCIPSVLGTIVDLSSHPQINLECVIDKTKRKSFDNTPTHCCFLMILRFIPIDCSRMERNNFFQK